MSAFACCRCARILLASLAVCAPLAAAAQPQPGVQFHGFVSQSYTWTSDNEWLGHSSDDGHFDFRELGVNASYQPRPNLRFAGQLLSRHAGAGERRSVQIDYALVDYSLVADESTRFGVRLGRVKNPFGLYNETRDVAFTRPSILLPQSVYFDRTRNIALSSDGVNLYAERQGTRGNLVFNLVAARPRAQDRATEATFFNADLPGRLKAQDTSYLAQLLFEGPGSRIRLALTAARVDLEYRPGAVDPMPPGQIRFQPTILSAQYNAETWSVTAEYNRLSIRVATGDLPARRTIGEGYYLQGKWRFLPAWEAILRYDAYYGDRDDRDGSRFAAPTGLPAHSRFARDWTLGVRFDLTRSLMLQAEYHRVNGTGWLSSLDNPDPSETEQRWKLFMLLGSYRS